MFVGGVGVYSGVNIKIECVCACVGGGLWGEEIHET